MQFAGPQDLETSLVLQLNLLGTVMPLDVPIVLQADERAREVVKFGSVARARELVDHLEANRLHYTQAILRALDAATVAALLARFTYRGLPLGMLVDTQPMAVTANFLVFKMNVSARRRARRSALGRGAEGVAELAAAARPGSRRRRGARSFRSPPAACSPRRCSAATMRRRRWT